MAPQMFPTSGHQWRLFRDGNFSNFSCFLSLIELRFGFIEVHRDLVHKTERNVLFRPISVILLSDDHLLNQTS